MEILPGDLRDLELECARLREERDALRRERTELVALWGKMREAYDNSRWCDMREGKCATLGGCSRCLTAERDALRLRLAEEQEKNRTQAAWIVDLHRERDEARFVAKKLAGWCYVTCPAKYHDTIRTALAYEVEP